MFESQQIASLHSALGDPDPDPTLRGLAAARALVDTGASASCVVEVSEGVDGTRIRGGAGDAESLAAVAVPLAEPLAHSNRALRVVESGERSHRSHVRYAAVRLGSSRDREILLVTSGGKLPTHRLEALALAVAQAGPRERALAVPSPCGELAADLAAEFGVEAIAISLFARAGMQLDLHTRAGDLVRRRCVPVSTVWGDAARHGVAYALGDLDTHAGMSHLAALGMRHAVLIPLENDVGVPVGSIGLASVSQLASGFAPELLERSRPLAREVMQAHARTSPQRGSGSVDQVSLPDLAARVGCRRFSVYMHQAGDIALLGCYAGDGTSLVAPPDPHEEALVRASGERGVSIVTDGAAVVLLANGVMLYASDPVRDPMEAVRSALAELVDDHTGEEDARRAA